MKNGSAAGSADCEGDDSQNPSSSEESEQKTASVFGFLRERFSSASARPKAAPKAVVKPKAKNTKHLKGSKGERKTVPGGERNSTASKRKSSLISQDQHDDDDLSMAAADQTAIDDFTARLDDLANLAPPLPEAQFKQYFAERTTALTAFAAEVRCKKKSAGRRANSSEDPFMLSMKQLEDRQKDISSFVKCT